jgi:L-lysine 6-transaminase
MWGFQHFGVVPDVLCFGKKTQVSGIMAGPRLDEVPDNVFRKSSRINSTWGGNLVDMVRCEIVLEAMREHDLIRNAERVGAHLLERLRALCAESPQLTSNPRGRGLMVAFDLPSKEQRDAVLRRARERGLLLLPSGQRALRMRPALTLRADEADRGIELLRAALQA